MIHPGTSAERRSPLWEGLVRGAAVVAAIGMMVVTVSLLSAAAVVLSAMSTAETRPTGPEGPAK
jgi:hypothetical protein